jgi:hypothetical protein
VAYKARPLCFKVQSLPVYEQLNHCYWIYVNDILIYGRSEAEIDNLIKRLKNDGIAFHKEGTGEGYLGINIQRDRQHITLKQKELTKQIIEALGLDWKYSTPVDTPAKSAALGKDIDGKVASGSINYASVVGMLLFLGHSSPDISFSAHQYDNTTIL